MSIEETQGFKSSRNNKSVAIIANDQAISSQVGAVINSMPNFSADPQLGTLAGMNGSAISLAEQSDLIIFETSGADATDIEAVAAIREAHDRETKLIAVTSANISLADARRLARAGVDDVVMYPFDDTDLREQVERLTTPNQLVVLPEAGASGGSKGKVITVAKSSGGIGATTVVVNLADQLMGRKGMMKKTAKNKVIVVDMDFQFGALASFLDVEPRDALFNLAVEGTQPDITFLRQSIVTSPCGIDVLTAPERFAPLDGLSSDQTRAIVTLLRAEYDYVIIDLPRALVEWLAPLLEETDRLLMVTDSSVPGIRQSRRLIDFFTEDNMGLSIEIVINREKKPVLQKGAHKEAAKVLERPLKYWLPPDTKAARAAADQGAPLSEAAGRSVLTKAMSGLAQSLSQDLNTTASNNAAARK